MSGNTKMLHIPIGVGSAALAAAVPYPGEATRISRKEQCVNAKLMANTDER